MICYEGDVEGECDEISYMLWQTHEFYAQCCTQGWRWESKEDHPPPRQDYIVILSERFLMASAKFV